MNPSFEFATATRIIFGNGTLSQIGGVARNFGSRALVVTGQNPSRAETLLRLLRANSIETIVFRVSGEPKLETVESGSALARAENCDMVISFGGGSAIDTGKAIAALITNRGALLDYLEVIGRAQPLEQAPASFIAIPTTAGTGAEVTRNAVLASPAHRVKVSLRSSLMLPRLALVDPQLTCDLPAAITAATGLDALTQLIEPFVCSRANPMTDALCVEGLRRAARSLRRAFENGSDGQAREDMAIASLFGGLALANAGLGAVHGFAAPIGGMFPAPHGSVCAALLPHAMQINCRALAERAPNHPALSRYKEVARLLTGNRSASLDDGIEWVAALVRDLKIPGLAEYGLADENTAELCQKAAQASSMKANPIALTQSELAEVLRAAL